MMKMFTLALALIAATPFANVAAEYVCHSDAFFHVKDDVSAQLPKAAIESLQSAMVDAFEEAYKNIDDIDMTSNKLESVSNNVCIVLIFIVAVAVAVIFRLLRFVSFRYVIFRFVSFRSLLFSTLLFSSLRFASLRSVFECINC